MADRPIENIDIMQDQLGRFLYVDTYQKTLRVSESRALYRWNMLTTMTFDQPTGTAKLTQRPDGQYDLISVLLAQVKNAEQWNNAIADNVGVFHSVDGKEWSPRMLTVSPVLRSSAAIPMSLDFPATR